MRKLKRSTALQIQRMDPEYRDRWTKRLWKWNKLKCDDQLRNGHKFSAIGCLFDVLLPTGWRRHKYQEIVLYKHTYSGIGDDILAPYIGLDLESRLDIDELCRGDPDFSRLISFLESVSNNPGK